MADHPLSLAATLAAARTKAKAVDVDAFDRRFQGKFEDEATRRWSDFDFVSAERRVDEVVAWAVAEVRAEVAASKIAKRQQVEREAAKEAERLALAERREQALWAARWLKPDPRFRLSASNHRIDAVYHWTPIRSLDSIMAVDIRPRAYLDRRGIWYEAHSYGTWQKALDFSGHVAVSLRPQRGMFSQVHDAVLLCLDRRVLARRGAFYVPGNSASRLHDFSTLQRRTSADDFEALFADPFAREPADWQAEIWVPDGISSRWIQRIIVRDRVAFDAATRAIARAPDLQNPPSIEIEPGLNEWTETTALVDLPF